MLILLFEFIFFFRSTVILWCLGMLQIIIYSGVMRQQDDDARHGSQSKEMGFVPIYTTFQGTICKMGLLSALPTTIVQIIRREII